MCAHGGGLYRGRVWRMWAYLSAYNLYMFVSVGTMVFQTIYFLSPPLCFSQILVGLQVVSRNKHYESFKDLKNYLVLLGIKNYPVMVFNPAPVLKLRVRFDKCFVCSLTNRVATEQCKHSKLKSREVIFVIMKHQIFMSFEMKLEQLRCLDPRLYDYAF